MCNLQLRWSLISCLLGKVLVCIYHFSCLFPQSTPFHLLRAVFAICCFCTGLQILPYPQHPAGIRKHPLTFPSGKESFKRKQCQHSAYLQLNSTSLHVCDCGAAEISVFRKISRTSLGSDNGAAVESLVGCNFSPA